MWWFIPSTLSVYKVIVCPHNLLDPEICELKDKKIWPNLIRDLTLMNFDASPPLNSPKLVYCVSNRSGCSRQSGLQALTTKAKK